MKFSFKSKTPFSIYSIWTSLLKWGVIAVFLGLIIGSCSALFLYLLDIVTNYRTKHLDFIYFLPLAGLCIGLLYFYWGKSVTSGNHLLVQEYQLPQAIVPLKMAPLILISTLITHLFGGSAGREGTAVQMGGSIADQLSRFFDLDTTGRKLLLSIGISAGFASVFGTPWAGTLFAIEVLVVGKLRYKTFLPCLIAAFTAHYTCMWWSIKHSVYTISAIPEVSLLSIAMVLGCGLLFGITALLFMKTTQLWSNLFIKWISYPPLRPFIGGILFLALFLTVGDTKYLGLGIPTLIESFQETQHFEVFLLKILFTSLTLGAGFKGGEVTPLFYIGATLGSFLSIYIPLPLSFLAGLGFIAVFAGATKAPWACTLMGMELFGAEGAVFLLIACWTATLFSGRRNLYNSPQHPFLFTIHNLAKLWWQKTRIIRSSNR